MKEFEKDFLAQLESRFPETLKALRQPLTNEVEKQLQTLAEEVALNFY